MFGHCTDPSVQVHNHTSFPIRPNQPCDASESPLRAGAAPSEQPSSWHQSFQSTDHPGAACHTQTATATGSPHTLCCHASHPLLQCHSCSQGSQTTCAVVLLRNDRGQVTSQEQGDQWYSTHHNGCWSHIQAGCWQGLIQLGHPSTFHWPADGQFQLLNGAEEDQVVTEVIRAASVGCIFWGLSHQLDTGSR